MAEKTVIDNLPPEITNAIWAVSYVGGATGPINGTGNINVMIDFPVGSTATFTVAADISLAATANLVNTASVLIGGYVDPNPANNSATDTDIFPCTKISSFGSAVISTAGNIVTISTCSFAGEYSTISGAVAGQTLQFTSSVPTDVITIHSGSPSGPVLASGMTALTFANTFTGTIYAHWNTPGCGSQSTCRTTTVQCLACVTCTIACPADISVLMIRINVECCNLSCTNYNWSCDTITTSPALVLLSVDETVTATSTAGPTCTFTVTVTDSQSPAITCPAPVTGNCASAVPAPDTA